MESEWLAPVLKTSISLEDMIPDSLIHENSDKTLDLIYEHAYAIGNLEDVLVVPDRTETTEVTLSSLVLDDREFIDTLTLLEIYPLSIIYDGKLAPLPEQNITTNESTTLDVSEQFFTTATFVSGFIDITISNDLPVNAEIMEFELLNESDKSVILNGVFTNLAPNTSETQSFPLAGKTVNGVLELTVKQVKTSASDGDVLVDVSKGIRTTLKVRDLKPQVATAIFSKSEFG